MIGLVNTRCSRCGCLVTDHDVDDEERRGCQKCECDQFEAPPDPVLGGEPGTLEWWRSPGYMIQGPADTILRLLEQEEISRRKALELLAYLHCGAPQDLRHAVPPAPWDKLNWCDDPPAGAGLPVREACRRRVPLDGADAQALEHALAMTEGERDSIRAVVDTVDAVLQGAGVHHASRAEAVRRVIRDRDALVLCRRAVETVQAHRECGQQPTLDPGGSGEYRRTRRIMEQALAAAVAAMTPQED